MPEEAQRNRAKLCTMPEVSCKSKENCKLPQWLLEGEHSVKEYINRYYYDNQVFKMLDIPVKPLPEHYDPQEYGRQLMRSLKDCREIQYANQTTLY